MQEIGLQRTEENPKPQILVGIREEITDSAAREREKKGTNPGTTAFYSNLKIFQKTSKSFDRCQQI